MVFVDEFGQHDSLGFLKIGNKLVTNKIFEICCEGIDKNKIIFYIICLSFFMPSIQYEAPRKETDIPPANPEQAEVTLPIHNVDRYIAKLREEMLGKAFDQSSNSGPLWELTEEQMAMVRAQIENFNPTEVRAFILGHLNQYFETHEQTILKEYLQQANGEMLLHLLEIIILFPHELENNLQLVLGIKGKLFENRRHESEFDAFEAAIHVLRARLSRTTTGVIRAKRDKTGRILKPLKTGF